MGLRIDLVDISHHQSGQLNFQKFKESGGRGVYHKATEGVSFRDGRYAMRREQVRQVRGLRFGAYHFARPGANAGDAVAEARFFLEVAAPKPGDLVPVLDIEVNDSGLGRASLTAWVGAFVTTIEKAIGVKPLIYTPFDLDSNFGCKLWVARYSNANTPPRIPAPWKSYNLWQFSNGVFGDPKSAVGIGNVDLNVLGKEESLLLVPEPKAPPVAPPKTKRLRIAHASLQFSDTDRQHTQDIGVLFSRNYDIITGTESGPGAGNTREMLETMGGNNNYFVATSGRYDTWVAVKKSLHNAEKNPPREIPVFALDRSSKQPAGYVSKGARWGDKGLVTLEILNRDLGAINIGAAHYLTHKSSPKAEELNEHYAHIIGTWGREMAEGSALAIVGADVNMVDERRDVFFGEPFATCWDDLEKWPNTGHGNIDVLARWKGDGRVKFLTARALNDQVVFLNTDHFLIEAVVEIEVL